LSAVTNPRLVTNGSEVGLVYSEGGLTITTSGAALQDGGLGDIVKVRNSDSGVTVTGVVQPDGTVRIRGG
jgi:flagella basal body P-ring formation protein FlgA